MKLNIIIDDDLEYRVTPPSFIRFTNSACLLDFMNSNPNLLIGKITFDNDLGIDSLEGYGIIKIMIKEQWNVEEVNIHSANVVAVKNSVSIINSAIKHGIIKPIPVTSYDLITYTRKLVNNVNR